MATHLDLDDHIAALVRSGAALREAAATAGLDAKVPTCPAWDVTSLVGHQGMVHRWATAEVDIDAALAADGIDELLSGFITRGSGRLHSAEPYQILVKTDDTGHAWTVQISDGPIVTTPGDAERPEVVFSGTAVQLYLSLWNRANEMNVAGRSDVVDQWHAQVRVRWS